MPKGKAYSRKNVGEGNTRTPKEVMGSQGQSTRVPYKTSDKGKGKSSADWNFQNRPTHNKKFPQ